MEPNRNNGIRFGDYSIEERKAAEARLKAHRLGANDRLNLEREREGSYSDNHGHGEKYRANDTNDLMTFDQWQVLRRTDKVAYERMSNRMARDREMLGDAFYTKDGRTGNEIYLQRQLDKSDAALEEKLNIFRSEQ